MFILKARRFIGVTLLAMMCSIAATQAWAQDTTAKILGQVSDASGAVIPDANVSVTNTDTKVVSKAQSDKQGNFQFSQLPIGPYTVSAAKEGFEPTTSPVYKLEINASQRVNFKMPVAGTVSSVEVSIQSAAIDTVSSTVGGSVTERPLVDLPLNGRNILDLARLQPGVTDGANPGNTSAGSVSIAGGRTDSVTYLLDGGNNSSLINNEVVFNPNPDAVEEFRILENNYSAEYGRNGGGVITVVTKGGTSEYHGTVYDFERNPVFNANDFFNKRNNLPRSSLKRHQFGATVGGEIFVPKLLPRNNRNFFFFSYEGQRLTNTVLTGAQQVFTTAQLAGDFSTSGSDGGPDPAIAKLLHDNPYFQPDPVKQALAIIDPTRIDPVAEKYIAAKLIPSSVSGSIAPVGAESQPFNQYSGRFDFALSQKDKLTFTLARQKDPSISPFGLFSTLPSPVRNTSLALSANIAYTRTFTANLLNEFRFVAQRLQNIQDVPIGTAPTPAQLGVGVTPDVSTGPTLLGDIPTGLNVGFSPQGPTSLTNNTFTYSDNLNWQKGRHGLKFGAYFSSYQNNTLFDYYVNGEFFFYGLSNYNVKDPAFATVGSATGYAEFLTGSPDEYLQFGSAPSNIRSKSIAFYAQDEWHVSPTLTLNYGVRYEYATPKFDTKGRSFSLVSGVQSTRFTGAPKGVLFPGDKGAQRGANFPDRKDFAPRFGFAYDAGGRGRTVIRGGTGLFYDILKGEDNLQFNGQAPFFGYADLFFPAPSGGQSATGNGYFQDPFGSTGSVNSFPSKPPTQNLDFGAAGFLPFGGGGVYFVDPKLRTPYTIQFNLGVQQALGRGITAETAYVGSVSRKYTGLADSNPFILGSSTKRLYDEANGGNGNFSYLDTFRNLTNGNYHSLQASMRKTTSSTPYVGTTYLQLSYTYGKNLDNLSGFRQRNGAVPYYNPNLFYAVSDADVRHRIVLSGGWDLPFAEYLHGAPQLLTKGWSLYPIASWQSGYPLDVSDNLSRSRTNPGPSGAGDPQLVRVNLVGSKVKILSPHMNSQADGGLSYISHSNFDANVTSGYGTLGRNSFYGPSRQNIDMTIAKATSFRDGIHPLSLELRGDFFNLLNTPEFYSPNTTITSTKFGEITQTYADSFRIIQLAGKLRF